MLNSNYSWNVTRFMGISVRKAYETHGVTEFYKKGDYSNPHVAVVQKFVRDKCSHYRQVIDLACGNGEVTRALPRSCDVVGIDPYLHKQYREKTGETCLVYGFADLARHGLPLSNFDAIICSFGLHLAEKSILPDLLYRLSLMGKELVVIGPTKLPAVKYWSWQLVEYVVEDRVHFRRFVPPVDVST